MSRLYTIEQRTVNYVSGPLLVADRTAGVGSASSSRSSLRPGSGGAARCSRSRATG